MNINIDEKEFSPLSQGLTDGSNGNTSKRATPKARNRARTWCFTLNNYTENEIVSLTHNNWDDMKINFYVFQKEIGENGTKHLQGVVGFNNQISFSSLKQFNGKAHWTKCRDKKGSIKYCSKEKTRDGLDSLYTYGNVDKWLWTPKKEKLSQEFILADMLSQVIESMEKNNNLMEEWSEALADKKTP